MKVRIQGKFEDYDTSEYYNDVRQIVYVNKKMHIFQMGNCIIIDPEKEYEVEILDD